MMKFLTAISDGLAYFQAVTRANCTRNPIVCGGGRACVGGPELDQVNTVPDNSTGALRSTYHHAIRPEYARRYLVEFQYRFKRRFDLCAFIPRLTYVSLCTPPMPERLLKPGLASMVIRYFLQRFI
ncbi:transposase [Microbulbifer sp. 2304DJ12-6]|uniref:transposase n=1 Tax=Microbulbifer sp. 2304DJ12-6 TaxID=3233340 RepID=UPI0039AFA325